MTARTLTGRSGTVDPVLLEIIAGSLASIEKEVETAIARTSRSPMIRDAHDFRAGIHDRLLRKLTGRSYSSLVHPIVRDFPMETMRPGDVFFHNDVYLSEGGIGHLPDLCVTVPVFHDGGGGPEVVAFVQAFRHHDDIGGAVPGSMPSHATSVFEEGLMVPPIRLWDAGVPNRAALTIMTRNSRMPDSLAADLDAECAACLLGARRLAGLFGRYGREAVEGCFDEIVASTTRTYRREILAKIPSGTWTWEDYAEHDGVDEPRLHAQRITLTKLGEDEPGGPRLILDFTGTGPQAKGPINHCANYADGNFLAKWLAPILRNLADTPERMAELDVNEGIVDLIEMRSRRRGRCSPPSFRRRPTRARSSSCDCSACWRACWPRRSAGGPPPTRRRSATPASTGRPPPGSHTSCGRCWAGGRAAGITPTGRTPCMWCPTPATCQPSSPRPGSRWWWSDSAWRWTRADPGSSTAGWATRSSSGCGWTGTSCRSPTARSCPAGA
jgi:N-methylhydantoinase B